jgi:hypothetical protein
VPARIEQAEHTRLLHFLSLLLQEGESMMDCRKSMFSMFKAKFGERLRSKIETAQVNELPCKILCHNLCCLISSMYELGVDPTFWTE